MITVLSQDSIDLGVAMGLFSKVHLLHSVMDLSYRGPLLTVEFKSASSVHLGDQEQIRESNFITDAEFTTGLTEQGLKY